MNPPGSQSGLKAGALVHAGYRLTRTREEPRTFDAESREGLRRTVAFSPLGEADVVRREAFERDAKLAESLSDPRIDRPEAWGVDDERGVAYVITAPRETEHLAATIERLRPLEPDAALLVALDVCAVLEAAHAIGLIHGALDATAIALVPAGEDRLAVRVGGFAIGRLESPWLSSDPMDDVRAVGRLLYFALSGKAAAPEVENAPDEQKYREKSGCIGQLVNLPWIEPALARVVCDAAFPVGPGAIADVRALSRALASRVSSDARESGLVRALLRRAAPHAMPCVAPPAFRPSSFVPVERQVLEAVFETTLPPPVPSRLPAPRTRMFAHVAAVLIGATAAAVLGLVVLRPPEPALGTRAPSSTAPMTTWAPASVPSLPGVTVIKLRPSTSSVPPAPAPAPASAPSASHALASSAPIAPRALPAGSLSPR